MERHITDEELGHLVFWPDGLYDGPAVRAVFRRVRRYIDFDGTIAYGAGCVAVTTLRGRPLAEFLSEEEYVVHTHGIGAAQFFEQRFPLLPKPTLMFFPPFFRYIGPKFPDDNHHGGKDFAALDITGAVIIDDLPPYRIHAPGCLILPP